MNRQQFLELEEEFIEHIDICYETFGYNFNKVVDMILESDFDDDSVELLETYLNASSDVLYESLFEATTPPRNASGRFQSKQTTNVIANQSKGSTFAPFSRPSAGPIIGGQTDKQINSQYSKDGYYNKGRLGRAAERIATKAQAIKQSLGSTINRYAALGKEKISNILQTAQNKFNAGKQRTSNIIDAGVDKYRNLRNNVNNSLEQGIQKASAVPNKIKTTTKTGYDAAKDKIKQGISSAQNEYRTAQYNNRINKNVNSNNPFRNPAYS